MKEFKADNLVIAKGGLKLKDSIPTDGCSRGAISAAGKECGPVSEHFGIAKASGEGQEMMMISPQGLSTAKIILSRTSCTPPATRPERS
jgi:hypothetical protein